MRLLYNIVNEFHIYFKKFKEAKFKDKLFAIIVYKNIFPEDFTSLSKNEGVLYNYLVKESAGWIKQIVVGLDKEIAKLNKEYETLESAFPNSLDELKRIYLFEYLNRKPQLVKFRQGSSNYSLSDMLSDVNFEMLVHNKLSWVDLYGSVQGFGFTFNEVEREIDPSISYNQRRELLEKTNSGKLGAIQKEIAEIEVLKSETRSKKIKDLIQNKHIKPPELPDKQIQLILIMLRNGYIEEDYLHYISYFYPGSISERDHWFLMNIRNELNTELNYTLDKCGNIIKRISTSDFRKPYTLNIGLVDFILGLGKTSLSKKEAIFNQLCDESKTSVTFIKGYIESGKHPGKFVKELCSKWPNIWSFIASSSEFNSEEVSSILSLVLNHAAIDSIKNFSSKSKFFLEITQNPNALNYFTIEGRLKEVVGTFELKFSQLNFKGVAKEVKEFIYTQNHYAINPSMVKLMMESFGTLDKDKFETGNYTAIQESKCPNLIAYIENNITDYVKDVYLKLESNTQESEEGLLKLVNNSNIPTNLKEVIAEHSNTKIDSFSKLDEPSELMNFLLDTSNIQSNWANIVYAFEKSEGTFSESLNLFLNYEENCDRLSKQNLIDKADGYKEFRIAFLLNDEIDDTSYNNYLKAFPFTYKDLKFEALSKGKVQSLVEKQKIAFTPTNYNKLKSKFSNLHLHLSINNMAVFFESYADIANVIFEEDLIGFLENQKLSDSNKIRLIERYNIDNHIIDSKSLTLIGNLSLKHPILKLSTGNLKNVLLESNLSQAQRIELYLRQPSLLDNNEFITNFLNILGGEFPKLNEKGPMPSFENRPYLISFFQYLKKVGKISKVKSNSKNIMVTTFRS